MRFRDRTEAGEQVATALGKYTGQPVVVYALPRGGVVLGAIIAERLGAPLDLTIPRKVGHPASPETAMCAVAENGYLLCNELAQTVDPETRQRLIKKEMAEAKRRRAVYLGDRSSPSVKDKVAIIVDDGIATGLTMRVAIDDIKAKQPRKIVVAIPVAPIDTVEKIQKAGDEVVVLESIPSGYFGAVGAYYENFEQVTDEEVVRLLASF